MDFATLQKRLNLYKTWTDEKKAKDTISRRKEAAEGFRMCKHCAGKHKHRCHAISSLSKALTTYLSECPTLRDGNDSDDDHGRAMEAVLQHPAPAEVPVSPDAVSPAKGVSESITSAIPRGRNLTFNGLFTKLYPQNPYVGRLGPKRPSEDSSPSNNALNWLGQSTERQLTPREGYQYPNVSIQVNLLQTIPLTPIIADDS